MEWLMKLATIPPLKLAEDTFFRDYQLLLPQLMNDERYAELHSDSLVEQYRIMDNGAAEGDHIAPAALYQVAEKASAHEVVITDRMGEGDTTQAILDSWEFNPSFNHMYVVHGRTLAGILKRAMYAQQFEQVTCIGLPRLLFDTIEQNRFGAALRGHLASIIKNNFKRPIDIHLLGSHPLWYNEAYVVASNPYIRGMDTSLPYYLAMYGHLFENAPLNLRRPKSYFRWVPENDSIGEIISENVRTMDHWIANVRP